MPAIVDNREGFSRVSCSTCGKVLVEGEIIPERYAPLISWHEREECPAVATPGLWLFDNPETKRFTEARMEALTPVLRQIRAQIGVDSALDVGCGLGDFSDYLSQFGIPRVVGVDGREENIAEARRRHPGVEFRVADAEELPVDSLGSFDLVLCFGLLYHLENPMRALRLMRTAARKVLAIETMRVPGGTPKLELLDESDVSNQGLRGIAFYPSDSCLVKMLHAVGFQFVYHFEKLPDNPNYAESRRRHRMRTMLVASNHEVQIDNLLRVEDRPRLATPFADPWATSSARFFSLMRRCFRSLRGHT